MYLAIKNVTPLPDYRLLLKFENDESRVFDVQPYLNIGKFSHQRRVRPILSSFIQVVA